MKNFYTLFASLLLFASGLLSEALLFQQVSAATVGLYEFDTLSRDWTQANGPERFFDSSGNDLHFDVKVNEGTVGLSSDVPSVAPANSFSLNFNRQQSLETPLTDLFTIGTTGELTVEFWYKPLLTDTLRFILSTTNGPDTWSITQATPVVSGTQGIDIFTKDQDGNVNRKKTENQFLDDSNPEWSHMAFTFDNASGDVKMYRDGALETSSINFGPYASTSHTLRIGANNPTNTFVGKFLMDDLRISNEVLLPGSGTGVDELAWNASLSEGPTLQPRAPDFGKQWVRNNPFMISSWSRPNYLDLHHDANFNTALSSEALPGTAGHFRGNFSELNDEARTHVQWGINAGVSAWLLRDELPPDEIAGIADVADYIRLVDPDSLIYVSLGGVTPSYVDNVLSTIQPDAFIYNFYPWKGATNSSDLLRAHLDNMQVARQKSLEYDIPAFNFIQSFDDLNNPVLPPDERYRLPSGSELRTELFLKLAGGFKGFTYFLFDLDKQSERFEKALVDRNGAPSELYPHAQQANAEIQVLGQSLRFLESTDWRHIWGGVTGFTPNTVPQWDPTAGQGQIVDIEINGTAADLKDAMVGYFEDDLGEEYFMLVNMWHGMGLDPDDLISEFTVTLDNSIDTIWRLNRLTGLVEEIPLVSNEFTFSLPGGTGDLFKLTDGDFAGLFLPGDFDMSGDVDGHDFLLWQRDQSIGVLADWQANYGMSSSFQSASSKAATVPEPTTGLLLVFGTCVFCSLLPRNRIV
ncbi:LamG domain-containing protein [Adhaeretor mobilis]|uniref:LamG-like jellyroll fold domain-containing protein n=1 Tax=Adhaeretor mobilis TaxID=1930276 RepID=A0A517MW36_9BACT|nr:LamG domain-containing protein [Adhaeretor mobilis]QDS99101.1 hypothetical protein HG15A2_23910 [Adhaeretor mobilis]